MIEIKVHLKLNFSFKFSIRFLKFLFSINLFRQMMVATQKLTSLAFAYYDGMRKPDDLNDDQKQQSIRLISKLKEF